MTTPSVPSSMRRRWRTWRWVGLVLVALAALAAVTALLTAPRPGGRMDPASTSPVGGHALVALLRDQGVDVEIADTAADATRLARPGSLLLVAQTYYLYDEELLRTVADAAGDLLLVEPTSRTREALAADIRLGPGGSLGGAPNCDLREANQAGSVRLGPTDTYQAARNGIDVTRCYDGALVRYRDGVRVITVVSTADFMTNSALLDEGNAALAMNLAGVAPRLIWYAPQNTEGDHGGTASITDLIPSGVTWLVWQLCLVVGLVAVWKGRRMGPLIAEQLPVVVRASETVEGRGRLYRSRRARDRAAEALRTATLQRLAPRLGLGANIEPAAMVAALIQNSASHADPIMLHANLFGPPPATDTDLVQLAHALDDIERQVARL